MPQAICLAACFRAFSPTMLEQAGSIDVPEQNNRF
jgi:hypothetical protein